jgi:predicted amidophosphoribosyltransferase
MKEMIWNWIHQQGRCCLHCGSFSAADSQFCRLCETDLWKRHSTTRAFELTATDIQAWALFDWYPDQDRKVSKLMMSLKGGRPGNAFDFYARAFVAHMNLASLPSNAVLMPCPNSKGRDHALSWAQALSKLIGIPIIQPLEFMPGHTSQKTKSVSERQKITFHATDHPTHKHVIFIDDIVTTGATAKAAKKALGRTQGFEVWCLAHRRQLAADLIF